MEEQEIYEVKLESLYDDYEENENDEDYGDKIYDFLNKYSIPAKVGHTVVVNTKLGITTGKVVRIKVRKPSKDIKYQSLLEVIASTEKLPKLKPSVLEKNIQICYARIHDSTKWSSSIVKCHIPKGVKNLYTGQIFQLNHGNKNTKAKIVSFSYVDKESQEEILTLGEKMKSEMRTFNIIFGLVTAFILFMIVKFFIKVAMFFS